MPQGNNINRRSMLAGAAAAMTLPIAHARANAVKGDNKICAFVKFLQTLSYDELAQTIAELGFDGIEATVRDGGQVLPERVEEDLPKLVAALKKQDLEITVMASSVGSVDQPHTEKVLRTAAALGVKKFRMKNYRYDLKRPIAPQLEEIGSVIKDLIEMSHELGLSAVYQNHSGRATFGAAIWDLRHVIEKYPVEDIGVAFDIRHATVEGGLCWPIHFQLMRPHLGAIYVKDFRWRGSKPENVPLGQGRVDKGFFSMLKESGFSGPISLHVEYLRGAGIAKNIAALKTDLKTLRSYLRA